MKKLLGLVAVTVLAVCVAESVLKTMEAEEERRKREAAAKKEDKAE